MHRVAVGTDVQVRSDPFVDLDGETVLDLVAAPVVTVTNAVGTSLPAPTLTEDPETHRWLATLTAANHLAAVDRLELAWTALGQTQRQTVDVAGARYATIADCRAVPKLANRAEFPAYRLTQAITEFEDVADRYRGVAFVRRVSVDRYRLTWSKDYVPFDRAEVRAIRRLEGPQGVLTPAGVLWDGAGYLTVNAALAGVPYPTVIGSDWDLKAVWEHGLDYGVPETLRRACVEYVRSVVLPEQSGLTRDVIATSSDGFVTRYSTPSWGDGRPTGWIEVDRLLNQLPDYRTPAIA